MGTYTTAEVVELSGATYRQVDYWAVNGLIQTLPETSPGSGNPRQWDAAALLVVQTLARLSKHFHQTNIFSLYRTAADQVAQGAKDVTIPLIAGERIEGVITFSVDA